MRSGGEAAAPLAERHDQLVTLGESGDVRSLVTALRQQGNDYLHRGETTLAAYRFGLSLEIARTVGWTEGVADATNCLATIAQRRGELDEAERLYNEAALLAERTGQRRLAGFVQQNLGVLACIRGDWDAALACYRLSLSAFEAEQDLGAVALILNNLGKLHGDRGEPILADRAFQRAIELARRLGDSLVECTVEQNRAELLFGLRKLDEAALACERALRLARERRDSLRTAETLKIRGKLERERGDHDRAIATLEEARELARVTEDAHLAAELICEIGEVWRRRGERVLAGTMWTEALAAFERLGALPGAADAGVRLRSIGGGR